MPFSGARTIAAVSLCALTACSGGAGALDMKTSPAGTEQSTLRTSACPSETVAITLNRSNAVAMYPQNGKNAAQCNSITAGMSGPLSIAADGQGNLYVGQTGTSGGYITSYKAGSNAVWETFTGFPTGPYYPQSIAVDREANVYVTVYCECTGGDNQFLYYPAGSPRQARLSPTETSRRGIWVSPSTARVIFS